MKQAMKKIPCHLWYSVCSFFATWYHGLAFLATDTMVQQDQPISLNSTFFLIFLSSSDLLCSKASSLCCLKSPGRCSAPWWWSRSTWQPSSTTQPSPPATWRLSCSSRCVQLMRKELFFWLRQELKVSLNVAVWYKHKFDMITLTERYSGSCSRSLKYFVLF